MSQNKYRPAFTEQEIQYLIERCENDSRTETMEMGNDIANRLKVFALKANLGITSAAFTSAPKESIESKLGLENIAEKRLAAFTKWQLNPAFCTAGEVRLANEYRYENNLMTKEEEEKYEQL